MNITLDSLRAFSRAVSPLCLFLVLLAPSMAADSPTLLTVVVPGKPPLALTAADIARMPRTSSTMQRDGETATYEGVLLYDILLKAYGVPPGKSLPLNSKLTYILGTARDGYQVLFALAEIAPLFAGARVVVADRRDGAALLAYQQPLQVIVPQDKAQGRSMYSLVRIEVVDLSRSRSISADSGNHDGHNLK
jgi:hypothetical protein